MPSSGKKRNKEDTWRADELEKSIKNALSDTSDKRSKHGKTKKKTKEVHKKEDIIDEVVTRKKQVQETKSERLLNKKDGRAKSQKIDEKDQPQNFDRPQKEDESRRTIQTDVTRNDGHERNEVKKDETLQSKDSAQTTDRSDQYDDDFEEYEDDFEDVTCRSDSDDNNEVDHTEVASLRKAMEEENDVTMRHIQKRTSASSKSSASSKPSTMRSRQTFINFTAAKERQINTKQSQRTKQRGLELMNLIELDVSTCSLLEMAPVKEYELYIKSYGRSDTKQAFVQCHDDILDRDIQTETIETRHAWTQHPAHGALSVSDCNDGSDVTTEDNALININSVRLTKFLEKASQVMNVILEEAIADNMKNNIRSNQNNIPFSQGYICINSDAHQLLQGRHVTHAHFHPVQTNLLLTVYSMLNEHDHNDTPLQAILCVWNVNDSSQPYRILMSKSEVKSCCFSPIKSNLAFAGTVEGAILVWDLREPSSMHQIVYEGDFEWNLRVPTYNTYGTKGDDNHHSVVVTVQPVITTQDSLRTSIPNASPAIQNEDMHGLSFQLASLDAQGVIHFWVVIELEKSDSAGSKTDLGLIPGGKVKLIRSSSIMLENSSRYIPKVVQANGMQFSLKDPNQFFVATDGGYILHGSRHGDRASPKCYKRQIDTSVDAIHLDLSPFGLPCFLEANTDGSICLYDLALDSPLITWSSSTCDKAISYISWSRSRPSVFYVVDVTSKIYIWELLACQGTPVKTEQFAPGRLSAIELSNDYKATGRGLPGRKPSMVITDDKGALEVHTINQHFSDADTDELEQMVAFLNSFK